jgi:predicted metal-binding membrane protein
LCCSGPAAVAALASGYTLWIAVPAGIPQKASMAMPERMGWGAAEFFFGVVMWAVLTTAMMLPSVAPSVLLHAGAALAQGVLHGAALTVDEMGQVVRPLGVAILLLAGAYQFTSLKRVCLAHCRSPLAFTTAYWRSGRWAPSRPDCATARVALAAVGR